jgi:hypothetical protein
MYVCIHALESRVAELEAEKCVNICMCVYIYIHMYVCVHIRIETTVA